MTRVAFRCASAWFGSTTMLLLLCSAQPAAGHGVLHEQIAEISERLELEPTSALLYLTRGKLHRLHEAWEAALADYDRAAQLDPGLEAVDVARGLLWLEAGRFHFALAALDRVLARNPDHAGARLTRARVLVRLEAYEAASRDYSHALKFLSKPDHYIERARALAALGEDHIGRAIRGLDEGRRRLGPIPTLQLYAIDLEVRLHRYDRALVRLGALRGHLGQPTWLARHAEILEQAGRLDQARTAYEAALDALRRLPLHRRQTHAMTQFGGRLHAALEQLTAALTSGTPLQHSTEVLGSP